MQKKYLMTPGPTPVPAEVLLTQAAPMIHHRTPDFSAAFMRSIEGLKYIFETDNDVLLFACSGTGAMESAIANCFSAGDTVIVCRNGKFGDRMKQISEVYGLNVIDLSYEWTQVVDPTDIATALQENPGVRGVIITQSETSSGVLNDVEAVGSIVKGYDDCVLIVDSITGIGAVECKTDEWGLDVVMTGSQKGLMLPPGLAALMRFGEGVEGLRALESPQVLLRLDEVQEEHREGDDAVHSGGLARAGPERRARHASRRGD